MPQLPLEYDHDTLAAQRITRSILVYLDAHGYEAWGQPNRGEYNPNSRRGVADIIGYRRADGRFLGVEVKAGRDTLRPEQIIFLNQLKAAGGLPFVTHSFAGFVASFERRGLHQVATTAAANSIPAPPSLATTQSGPLTTNDTPAIYVRNPAPEAA